MRSSLRRSRRRDNSSKALSILGNLLLFLATLAVAGLVTYLVLNPPGVLDPASQQSLPTPPGATGTASGPTPSASGSAQPTDPNTSGAPGQLSLGTACGGVSPLLDRADEVRNTAIDDSNALNSESISNLPRDLQTLSDISPDELASLIDPLTSVLVELNNSVLAGEENPQLDTEAATASTDAMRTLCQG